VSAPRRMPDLRHALALAAVRVSALVRTSK
jgi:hypothetical protein